MRETSHNQGIADGMCLSRDSPEPDLCDINELLAASFEEIVLSDLEITKVHDSLLLVALRFEYLISLVNVCASSADSVQIWLPWLCACFLSVIVNKALSDDGLRKMQTSSGEEV
jgi:hypothetical protein